MTALAEIALRPPEQVMRLHRMGQMFPTRLSFLRVLLRKLSATQAKITRPIWDISEDGFGYAIYTVSLREGDVSLFATARPLDDSLRSDRVIATAWDAAFVLYDGNPSAQEIERLNRAAPGQEAARFTERDLVLSRANKSVRLFNDVVQGLRIGRQPSAEAIARTGYLMRTTAVYGNGKFGLADYENVAARPILGGAYMAEMLTVWLIRAFTIDLVEHLGGGEIERGLKRHLGVGNATGLGMAPYLISHPHLLNAWFQTRERALARVRALGPGELEFERARKLARRVSQHLAEWNVGDAEAMEIIRKLRREWRNIESLIERSGDVVDAEAIFAEAKSVPAEELTAAYLIELGGSRTDDLADEIATATELSFDPNMSLGELQSSLAKNWDWATSTNYSEEKACRRFWYVSEEKLEPRIGDRFAEPGAEQETPLDIARRVAALDSDLTTFTGSLAEFAAAYPHHRAAIARAQGLAQAPFSEIRDNLIAEDCRPIDMLRAKLSVFGAAKFDPKSDLWTRISLAQGAPLIDELQTEHADDWWLAAMDS